MSQRTPSSPSPGSATSKKSWCRIPDIYAVLFVFIALAAIATHFVPAGQFERVPGPNGRITIDPTSYEQVASSPVGIVDFMMAIPNGLMSAGEVVFFTFMIGGMFMVLRLVFVISRWPYQRQR